jgi:hypothetical protein
MSIFSRKPDLQIVKLIEEDLKQFIHREINMYRNSSGANDLQRCVIVNMAILDPASLRSEEGRVRIKVLFGGQSPMQNTAARLRDFIAYMYIRYGEYDIDTLKQLSLMTFTKLYNIPKKEVKLLQSQYNTFWMMPLIKKCYTEMI